MTECSSGGCWSNWEDPPEPDCPHEKCYYVSWLNITTYYMHPICDLDMLLCIMQHDLLICILIIYMTNIMVREVAQFCRKENLCYRSLAFMWWYPRNTGAMERENFIHRSKSWLEISVFISMYKLPNWVSPDIWSTLLMQMLLGDSCVQLAVKVTTSFSLFNKLYI